MPQFVTLDEFRTTIGRIRRMISGAPTSSGGTTSAAVPTGTGFRHVTSGAEDAASKLVEAADVAAAAGIQESKLSLNYATHAEGHATRHKTGGADAIKLDELATPDDVTTLNASTSRHGLCPKFPGGTTNFLREDGTFAAPGAATVVGYVLPIMAANLPSPADSSTYFFGGLAGLAPQTTEGLARIYVPKAGSIKRVMVFWRAGTAGSNETIAASFRINAGADNGIQDVANSDATKVFDSGSISISVAAGDYIEVNLATPAWSSNPGTVALGGAIYIE